MPDQRLTAKQAQVEERVRALETMDLTQLRAQWRNVVRSEPHIRLSTDLLRRGVAHVLQEAVFGSLSAAHGRKLAAVAQSTKETPPAAATLKAGTTLVREWHGHSHVVRALEAGFDYQGRRYASLTQIAREITGAAWSGPRFFGVHGQGAQFRATRSAARV